MSGHLNFDSTLPHQSLAVESVISLFTDLDQKINADYANPIFIDLANNVTAKANLARVLQTNGLTNLATSKELPPLPPPPPIYDIHMETGTGKTYTYAKTMAMLHHKYGLFKFIVAVPSVTIKAGTEQFLKSHAAKIHFRTHYNCEIECYTVQSDSGNNKNRSSAPSSIRAFTEADDPKAIHILLINQGMINSPTVQEFKYEQLILGITESCRDALGLSRPILILDEPHKFKDDTKTWANMLNFKPQLMLRYGATFHQDRYTNFIYSLNAYQAFNNDLVKGITVHIEKPANLGSVVKIVACNSTSKIATFIYSNELGDKTTYEVGLKEVLPQTEGLHLTKINSKEVELSNGLILAKGDSIYPEAYHTSIQETMLQKAVAQHFELEEELMLQDNRIKPMSLFFIDQITSYRSSNKEQEYLRIKLEHAITAHLKRLLEKYPSGSYHDYLFASLNDVSLCHGGYFSKDNDSSDKKIEQEINEILYDKEELLAVSNPRRFIFSKWTLKEGWDNPNIFVICKLRGSGSDINKLQEVGRGLRLPVNEFMNRVASGHHLHYFVDFTEQNFVETLLDNINNKVLNFIDNEILSDDVLQKIAQISHKTEHGLFSEFFNNGWIDHNRHYQKKGFNTIKDLYPGAFTHIKQGKIINSSHAGHKDKATIRPEKYSAFKELWEAINLRCYLTYHLNPESYQSILNRVISQVEYITPKNRGEQYKLEMAHHNNDVGFEKMIELDDHTHVVINSLSYANFLKEIEHHIHAPNFMLHKAFLDLNRQKGIDINKYLNKTTVMQIKQAYKNFMMKSPQEIKISYQSVAHSIHPTALTDPNGYVLQSTEAHNLGIQQKEGISPVNYLYDQIIYDSDLEKDNIINSIKYIEIYAKIPKNSLKIALMGGGSYSPDFAYVIKKDGGVQFNLIVETKGKNERDLSNHEETTITSAKHWCEYLKEKFPAMQIDFKKQLTTDKISELIASGLESTTYKRLRP